MLRRQHRDVRDQHRGPGARHFDVILDAARAFAQGLEFKPDGLRV